MEVYCRGLSRGLYLDVKIGEKEKAEESYKMMKLNIYTHCQTSL
jgi:hypothetical protein